MPLPLEIIGLNRPDITLVWEDEHRTTYSARALRLRCRCAHCVEEMSGRPLLDPGTISSEVRPLSIALVGAYGLRIHWSDGHSTGIYTFEHLHRTCPCPRCAESRGIG